MSSQQLWLSFLRPQTRLPCVFCRSKIESQPGCNKLCECDLLPDCKFYNYISEQTHLKMYLSQILFSGVFGLTLSLALPTDVLPRYNETCSSLDESRICENDCSTRYDACLAKCNDEGNIWNIKKLLIIFTSGRTSGIVSRRWINVSNGYSMYKRL